MSGRSALGSQPSASIKRRGVLHSPRSVWIAIAGISAALLMIAGWHSGWSLFRSNAELLDAARTVLKQRDYDRAEKLAQRIPPTDADWPQAQLVAGEAALRAKRPVAAREYFAAIPRDGSSTAIVAVHSLGEAARDFGSLSEAYEAYSYVLKHQPQHTNALRRVVFLLGTTGQRWESLPYLMTLLRRGDWNLFELVLLGDVERPLDRGSYLRHCTENAPNDVLVRMGLAANAEADGRADEARERLRGVIADAPHLVAAHALLGELLVDGDEQAFADWHARLPASADESPDIWLVRGLWARRHGELRVAARCFWETVRRYPCHRRGTYQLGQVLVALGESSGQEFAERASQLFELTQALDLVLRYEGQDERQLRRVTELMEGSGRIWEACAWAATAGERFPRAVWPHETIARLSPQLTAGTPQTVPSANLAMRHDLSTFPDPQAWIAQFDSAHRGLVPQKLDTNGRSSIRFEEAVME